LLGALDPQLHPELVGRRAKERLELANEMER